MPSLDGETHDHAVEEETVHTILFGHGWPPSPYRVLRTHFVQEWLGEEERAQQARADEPVIGETRIGDQEVPVLRFMGFPPSTDARGDLDSMGLYAGQSVGLVHEIKPAAEIVHELVDGATQIIKQRLTGLLSLD